MSLPRVALLILGLAVVLPLGSDAHFLTCAQVLAKDIDRPDQPGEPQRRLKSLTASFSSREREDFGDPSAPDFSELGVVKVFTTGGLVLKWEDQNDESATSQFLRGVAPRKEALKLKDDTAEGGFDPWDPTIETFPEFGDDQFLFAGVMTPISKLETGRWPEDNWRRRVNAFRWSPEEDGKGSWIRIPKSLLGDAPEHFTWLNHSYGHHVIRDEKNQPWMFYEKVTEEKDGHPFKTEIFARRMLSPTKLSSKEISILKLPEKAWPRAQHGIGFLIEGPRPVRVGEDYIIGFSAGNYNSPNYGMHFMASKNLTGPYKPYLNAKKSDLKDFGESLEKNISLTWGAGRPAVFEAQGQWWILFHGIDTTKKSQVEKGQRSIYLAPVEITSQDGEAPLIEIGR